MSREDERRVPVEAVGGLAGNAARTDGCAIAGAQVTPLDGAPLALRIDDIRVDWIDAAHEAVADHEQKRLALGYLQEAWTEASHEGIDGDCLAQTALFLALADLITTYGEEATAQFAEKLSARIRNGEFSIQLARQ